VKVVSALTSVLDTGVDCYTAEISHCKQFYDYDTGLVARQTSPEFISHSCPVALELVAVPASQAYFEHAFSVCSDM